MPEMNLFANTCTISVSGLLISSKWALLDTRTFKGFRVEPKKKSKELLFAQRFFLKGPFFFLLFKIKAEEKDSLKELSLIWFP